MYVRRHMAALGIQSMFLPTSYCGASIEWVKINPICTRNLIYAREDYKGIIWLFLNQTRFGWPMTCIHRSLDRRSLESSLHDESYELPNHYFFRELNKYLTFSIRALNIVNCLLNQWALIYFIKSFPRNDL